MKSRGNIMIGSGVVITLILAGLGYTVSWASNTSTKVDDATKELRSVDTLQNNDISTLKADVSNIKENVQFIRDSQKEILSAVRK